MDNFSADFQVSTTIIDKFHTNSEHVDNDFSHLLRIVDNL
ncbi:hypothetical protein B4098_2055 [Heyndrickxia coagulans]|uniref:Uncharacterized protein n=1 Tax=Heyndrickxia coagulans TaxID=1398 RepID=A0A150JW25_HEYCO|nr:hypothetical protein B4098_2055 [Heyndrickxia coagulans]